MAFDDTANVASPKNVATINEDGRLSSERASNRREIYEASGEASIGDSNLKKSERREEGGGQKKEKSEGKKREQVQGGEGGGGRKRNGTR